MQKDVDRERPVRFNTSGVIDYAMQADTSRQKESLQLETKRREGLKQ